MGTSDSVKILAERVRAIIDKPTVVKRMFGGLTFMLNGNMLCCISTKGLMARVGAAAEADALTRPFATRCLGAGRPMAGFILVDHRGVASDTDLRIWVELALDYVGNLPPKKPKTRKTSPHKPEMTTRTSRKVS
ncbi:MAG: TfoX/Sxy family protein [Sphingomonadales bacterium]|nr:TfoX/Sxy family protein [Sphingomonadales bacterium]